MSAWWLVLIIPLSASAGLAAAAPTGMPAAAVLLGADGAVSAFALRRTGTTDVLKWYE